MSTAGSAAAPGIALQLATWAHRLRPNAADGALADRALRDTVAVAVAARGEAVLQAAGCLSRPARWAIAAHVLDFDDLHMESTTHISAVCVPATLAAGGDARAYLAGAGIMARLGVALGWPHYASGWHTTCTAGAPAAAAVAAISMGLTPRQTATAMALAVPAAGGVQRAFGTDAKSLQVGFSVEAGLRAARLAAAGAGADPGALDEWLRLVGGSPDRLVPSGPAVPGGLAVKLYPCCYALQRAISAVAALAAGIEPDRVVAIAVRTPEATVAPLIHHRPRTGLQAKFSLEYAIATALLDRHQGFASFTDAAVRRPEAQRLVECVKTVLDPGGDWLLAGDFAVEITLDDGSSVRNSVTAPPGSPQVPLTDEQFSVKLADCLDGTDVDGLALTWSTASETLAAALAGAPCEPDGGE